MHNMWHIRLYQANGHIQYVCLGMSGYVRPHVLTARARGCVALAASILCQACKLSGLGCGRIIMALLVCNKALIKDDRLLQHTWPSASLTALSTSSSGTSMMSSNRLHKKELSSSNTSTHGVPPSDSSAMNAISC